MSLVVDGMMRGGVVDAIPTRQNTRVIPRFYVERVRLGDQIDPETGLPAYQTFEMVDLLVPGDQKSIPAKRVNDAIRRQFKTEYDAWRAAKENDFIGDGLPLRHWPQIPPELAMGLAHANIHTVQQLAGLTDSQCNIKGALGLRKYRDMAKAFVDASTAAAPIAKLEQENSMLLNRLSSLERQFEDLKERSASRIAELENELGQGTPDLSQADVVQRKKGK